MTTERARIISAARSYMDANALILDTETTGVGDQDEIVEVALIDAAGALEFASLVKPSRPIPAGATAIHGITDAMVERAPSWPHIWLILRAITGGRMLLAYNSDFDGRLVEQTSKIYGLHGAFNWRCLMKAWSSFHGLERWQKLEKVCLEIGVEPGEHRALADAKAAREALLWLARRDG